MENNIPTLYILQHHSYVVKSAKIFNYFRPFCQKNIKHSSYCHGNMHINGKMTQAKWACAQC